MRYHFIGRRLRVKQGSTVLRCPCKSLRFLAQRDPKDPRFSWKREISYARASFLSKANCDRLCSLRKVRGIAQNIYHMGYVIQSAILKIGKKRAFLKWLFSARRVFFHARNPGRVINGFFFLSLLVFSLAYVSCEARCEPTSTCRACGNDNSNLFLTNGSLLPRGPYFRRPDNSNTLVQKAVAWIIKGNRN